MNTQVPRHWNYVIIELALYHPHPRGGSTNLPIHLGMVAILIAIPVEILKLGQLSCRLKDDGMTSSQPS